MRRVEFSGLPGSGKTAIITKAREALCATDSRYFDRARLARMGSPLPSKPLSLLQRLTPPPWRDRVIRHLFWTMVVPGARGRVPARYPELLSAICRAVTSSDEDPGFGRRFIDFSTDVMAWDFIASERLGEQDVFLCDEGFVQRAIGLFGHGDPKDWVSLMPRIDLLFVIRASRETCLARMRERPKGPTRRFLGRTTMEIDAVLELMELASSEIVSCLSESGTSIVRLDTDVSDLRTSAQIVIDATEAMTT